MKFLKLTIFAFYLLLTSSLKAQELEEINFNLYDNHDSNFSLPDIDLHNLPYPTLFILNNQRLKAIKYSDLQINKKIEKVLIIQDKEELEAMKLQKYRAVVFITTKSEN